MGLNFRKSFNHGPFRLTLGKKGISASVGVKGARISKSTSGKTTKTLSIPGSGLYHTTTTQKKKKSKESKIQKKETSPLDRFNFSEKELELFGFVVDNLDNLPKEFSMHDIATKGLVTTRTYYNNLYDKGIFLKPARGKYSLNINLLEDIFSEERE